MFLFLHPLCNVNVFPNLPFNIQIFQRHYVFKLIYFHSPHLSHYYTIRYFHKLSVHVLEYMDTYATACKNPEVGKALAGIQGLFTPRRGFCSAKIPGTFSMHKGSAGLSTAS